MLPPATRPWMSEVEHSFGGMDLLTPARPLDVPGRDLAGLGLSLVPLNGRQWRVTGRDGLVFGHLEEVDGPTGPRYRGKRFSVRERGFRMLGDFPTPGEAVDAIRFG